MYHACRERTTRWSVVGCGSPGRRAAPVWRLGSAGGQPKRGSPARGGDPLRARPLPVHPAHRQRSDSPPHGRCRVGRSGGIARGPGPRTADVARAGQRGQLGEPRCSSWARPSAACWRSAARWRVGGRRAGAAGDTGAQRPCRIITGAAKCRCLARNSPGSITFGGAGRRRGNPAKQPAQLILREVGGVRLSERAGGMRIHPPPASAWLTGGHACLRSGSVSRTPWPPRHGPVGPPPPRSGGTPGCAPPDTGWVPSARRLAQAGGGAGGGVLRVQAHRGAGRNGGSWGRRGGRHAGQRTRPSQVPR